MYYNSNMAKSQPTNEDIMTTLSQFATSVDERFSAIEEKLENMATKDDINRLESLIDDYAAKPDAYTAEMAAMQHKIDRLERMILYLADKAHIPREALESI